MTDEINKLGNGINFCEILRLCSAWPVMAKVFAAREACTLGLLKWMIVPSSLNMLTSSIPGMLLTVSFFKELWSFLSSVVAVRWTTFFFLRAVPGPPILTWDCNFANFSAFILQNKKNIVKSVTIKVKYEEDEQIITMYSKNNYEGYF